MKKSIVIFTAAVLLMLVCGCTQPAPVQPAATPTLTATQTTTVTPPAIQTTGSVSPTLPNKVSDNTIRISKKGFDPVSITVKSGSTVRWVNEDSTTDPGLYNPTHRIELVNIKNSPLLSSGQGWSWIFDQPGSYEYNDMLHSIPMGTIVVV
ncbi:MAG: cupredoxin domain-containing protein [Methanomicrobiales archaeon]